MDQREFFKALEELPDDFFIWNDMLRTRVRGNLDSVDPIMAVARHEGYKGKDITEAVEHLKLDYEFAVKILEISEGKCRANPTDLKIRSKLYTRTVRK